MLFINREVKDHLNYEHRVFNSEEFLKTRAPGDQPFYKKVNSALGILQSFVGLFYSSGKNFNQNN